MNASSGGYGAKSLNGNARFGDLVLMMCSVTVEYDEELSKTWLEREKTESEYRMCKVRMGLERIGEKFWELWD